MNSGSRLPMKGLDSLDAVNSIDRIVVPDARDFESSVDAFRLNLKADQREVLLFQMTVEQNHPIKHHGVKQVMDKIREKIGDDSISLKLVFVVPDDVESCYRSPHVVFDMDSEGRRRGKREVNNNDQFFISIGYE